MDMNFDDLFSVKGKVVLVTGGSRGIGEMIAAGFLKNGAKVYISSRKADACAEAVERLKAYGPDVEAIPSDLSGMEGIEHLVSELSKKEERLDVLINNAGAAWGADLDDFPEIGWDKVMDVNVKGVFFLTQKCLPLMRASASAGSPARVINIGSIDGLHTPGMNNYSYSPSKAAVHHMTRVLGAQLVKEHILMNAIAPGPFPTWMLSTGVGFGGETENADWETVGKSNPSGRVGAPSDVAGLAIFLSSKASSFIVGQVVALDGGIVTTS